MAHFFMALFRHFLVDGMAKVAHGLDVELRAVQNALLAVSAGVLSPEGTVRIIKSKI